MNEHKQKKYLVHFFHPVCQEQCTSPKMSSFYLLCFALADLATLASTDADAKTWGAVTRWTISVSCRRTHHWTESNDFWLMWLFNVTCMTECWKKGTSWTLAKLIIELCLCHGLRSTLLIQDVPSFVAGCEALSSMKICFSSFKMFFCHGLRSTLLTQDEIWMSRIWGAWWTEL